MDKFRNISSTNCSEVLNIVDGYGQNDDHEDVMSD